MGFWLLLCWLDLKWFKMKRVLFNFARKQETRRVVLSLSTAGGVWLFDTRSTIFVLKCLVTTSNICSAVLLLVIIWFNRLTRKLSINEKEKNCQQTKFFSKENEIDNKKSKENVLERDGDIIVVRTSENFWGLFCLNVYSFVLIVTINKTIYAAPLTILHTYSHRVRRTDRHTQHNHFK